MVYGKAEDAGGLSPAKDDNAAVRHFIRRTLPILGRVDYNFLFKTKTLKSPDFKAFVFVGPKGLEPPTYAL